MTNEVLARDDDRAQVLAEIDRFARQAIEPAAARPESPMDGKTLRTLLLSAEEMGLAAAEDEPSGVGPWEELDVASPPGRTLAALERLARANASVALVLHQRALARSVTRMHALGADHGPLAIAPEGRIGLGRTALARALAGAKLDEDDRAILADVYGDAAPHLLPIDPDARGVLSIAWREGAGFTLRVHANDALVRVAHTHAHGLDELRLTGAQPIAAPKRAVDASPDAIARVIAAHQLGLVAIALGAASRGHRLARAFAAERRQGGAPIERHPAVLGLLGKTGAALASVAAQLEAHGARSIEAARLGLVLALRAEAMPALADAANASIQAFGGLGYMRDTGVEKVARDVNALRALAGTPPELLLIAAEWERLHG
jgi:alkylation response protein AidB-like acyl-CoA dehydrogenase